MSEFLQKEEGKAKAQAEETWSQEFVKILRASSTHALVGLFVGDYKVALARFSGTFISKSLKEYVWEDSIPNEYFEESARSGLSDYVFRAFFLGKSLYAAMIKGPLNFVGYQICGALGFSAPTCTITIETVEGTIDTAVSLGVASFAGFIPSLIVATKILAASTIIEATFATASLALSEEQLKTPNLDRLINIADNAWYVGSSLYDFVHSLKDFHEFEDESETNLGWWDLAMAPSYAIAHILTGTIRFSAHLYRGDTEIIRDGLWNGANTAARVISTLASE